MLTETAKRYSYIKYGEKLVKPTSSGFGNQLFLEEEFIRDYIEPYGFVYKITNLANDKVYIGQTVKPIHLRFKQHVKAETYIGRSIRKHRECSFEIEVLSDCYSEEDLIVAEKYFIDYYSSTNINKGYNIDPGGHKNHRNLNFKNELNPNYKKGFYKWWMQKYGKKIADEKLTKFKQTQKIIGRATYLSGKNPNFTMKGRKQSKEAKDKISKANAGLKRGVHNKTSYHVWENEHGKEYADKKQKEMMGNRNKTRLNKIFSKERKYIYGADISLTHIGIVKLRKSNKKLIEYYSIENKHIKNRFLRQSFLVNEILRIIPPESDIAIEGYAYSIRNEVGKDSEFKEMMGILFFFLIQRKCSFWLVTPISTRNYILGDIVIRKNLSEEENKRREDIKKHKKRLILEYVERDINKKFVLDIKGQPKSYDDCLKKDKVRFEDIADAYVTALYWKDKNYGKEKDPYRMSPEYFQYREILQK